MVKSKIFGMKYLERTDVNKSGSRPDVPQTIIGSLKFVRTGILTPWEPEGDYKSLSDDL